MKAIVQDRYGEADVLHVEDIDIPSVGGGEVLLRVEARASSLETGTTWPVCRSRSDRRAA